MNLISSPHDFFVVLCALTFLGIFSVAGAYLYWGYTCMEEILDRFRSCTAMTGSRFYLQMGPWGRLVMVGMAAGFLAFPASYIKKGILDASEIDTFPQPLKRRLIMSHYLVWGLGGVMILSVSAMKLIECCM
ncbi:hypothetical protein [Pseudomonas chlororaphis]|uniref:hypothetical protein n=1 Tax=Pseudomonas chlororaphis TaxID=587753 RepID=UPI000D111D67|nr:hypothetical protein [Pseudomonas chlororaphis]AVO58953.1 hypothetical protein C6Q18_13630 [Pseudomonas chlororaphis subsp. piscium]NNB42479.1 hypothetical protein [Pseudomonas chlororaphis]